MNMDFRKAGVSHFLWKRKLRAFLDGKETLTETQALSEKDCDLGKWLYGGALIKYGGIPEMHDLESLHATLHKIVKKILELQLSGNKAAAEKEYTNIDIFSKKIIGLLAVLETKINY